MRALFVDTGALIAKEIVGDQFHPTAKEAWAEVARSGMRLLSSEHVFDESATLIARRATYSFAAQWGVEALDSHASVVKHFFVAVFFIFRK